MMRGPRSAGCAGLGWGTWGEADPRGGRAPPPSAPRAGHGGRRSRGGGGRAASGACGRTGGSGSAVAGDVARRAAMEAMESAGRENCRTSTEWKPSTAWFAAMMEATSAGSPVIRTERDATHDPAWEPRESRR